MIIDTHLHLVSRQALRYPWLAGEPKLDRDWSYATYALEARRLGVTAALHVEVDVAPEDIANETAYVEGQAREPGSLLCGAIAACRPEEGGFRDYLAGARETPFVKGFRRVLHVAPDGTGANPLFRENIRALGDTGLPFDICALPRQMADVIGLVDGAPDVQFVLDHCGVPDIKGDTPETFARWKAGIREIAERPHVAAKISGVVAYADPGSWMVETLRPYVEHVIESFGWNRVVGGSDWPGTTLGGGLPAWVGATQALVAGASNDERRKLFSQNARRIWRL